jgi:hypothetical protein
MEEIDKKLNQWIHDSVVRAEIRELIIDHVISAKAEGFKVGWTKGGYVENQMNQLINKSK